MPKHALDVSRRVDERRVRQRPVHDRQRRRQRRRRRVGQLQQEVRRPVDFEQRGRAWLEPVEDLAEAEVDAGGAVKEHTLELRLDVHALHHAVDVLGQAARLVVAGFVLAPRRHARGLQQVVVRYNKDVAVSPTRLVRGWIGASNERPHRDSKVPPYSVKARLGLMRSALAGVHCDQREDRV